MLKVAGGFLAMIAITVATLLGLRHGQPKDAAPLVVVTTPKGPESDWQETLRRNTAQNNYIAEGDSAATTTGSEVGPYQFKFDKGLGKNLTDRVGQNLAANYLEAAGQGKYTSDVGNSIAQGVVNGVGDSEIFRTLSLKDIKVGDNSQKTITAYFESAGDILENHASLSGKELGLIINALNSQDLSSFKLLGTYIDNYQEVLSQLRELVVPEKFANLHLAFLQDYDTLAHSLQSMKDGAAQNDYVFVARELGRYTKALKEINAIFKVGESIAIQYGI